MTRCYLGIDLGISGARTAAITESGRAIVDAEKARSVPVILAGGAFAKERQQLVAGVATAIGRGTASVAFGRNARDASDLAAVARGSSEIIHPRKG